MDIEVHPHTADFEASVRSVCGLLVPAAELAAAQVSTRQLTLGITNQLFVVSVTASSPTASDGTDGDPGAGAAAGGAEQRLVLRFLMRIFGGEGIIDRSIENELFATLASAGIAPGYLGRFANGRCEEWLEGWKNLDVPDVADPAISACVAAKLAEVHAFRVPPPLSDHFDPSRSGLWAQLTSWVDVLEKSSVADESVAGRLREFSARFLGGDGFPDLRRDIAQMQASAPTDARVCFCHNDMLAFNIMRRDAAAVVAVAAEAGRGGADDKDAALGTDSVDSGSGGGGKTCLEPTDLKLIDFEYGCYNYRGFDVANYFCEWAGGNEDAKPVYANFPNAAQQRFFCAAYLEACAKLGASGGASDDASVASGGGGGENGDGGEEVVAVGGGAAEEVGCGDAPVGVTAGDPDELATLMAEVTFFVPLVHLYWSVWALNQAREEGCEEFDYILFATNRMEESLKRRVPLLAAPAAP